MLINIYKITNYLILVCNLGGNWPSTLALWSVDLLTWKTCHNSSDAILDGSKCNNAADSLVILLHSFFLIIEIV